MKMASFRVLDGKGITCVKGIKAVGKFAGIKSSRKDFCVVASDAPAAMAAVFTQNTARAPPVILGLERLKHGKCQALNVVSGVANAGTGKEGLKNAKLQAKLLADELGISEKLAMVGSTGIIGKQMPMAKIESAMNGVKGELSDSEKAGMSAVEAIMTTDTKPKFIAVQANGFAVAGMAKGSGMIAPNMATMLCYIFTDAAVGQNDLQAGLSKAVEKSFNCISVDACESTNDTVLLLANGLSGKRPSQKEFQEALDFVCLDLAKKIVLDGEGASKMFSATVRGARDFGKAKEMALAIVKSDLVKTAVFGNDPNWGRVLQAIGQTRIPFEMETLAIFFGKVQVVKNGLAADFNLQAAQTEMSKSGFEIIVIAGNGKGEATAYGCDLTEGYIKVNAEYPT
ncbi:MAG: bifunctional glutamate N-acetyltransferase/amino-acid acetyltransferase ArgJ [Candidatus Diapherotrites archaeon]|nr:bifunctional glutamate N-acetyltransferase/amino-acid acetyltransferase ArgJ [Candidatus Diapherotrites archaeon]